jgi:hypothetical protein
MGTFAQLRRRLTSLEFERLSSSIGEEDGSMSSWNYRQKKLWRGWGEILAFLLAFLRGVLGKTVDGDGHFVVRSW